MNQIRTFLAVSFVALAFSACKKEEINVAEIEALAKAKMQEIETLTSSIPCEQSSQVTVETIGNGCYNRLYPVTEAIKEQFITLRNEYRQYQNQLTDYMIRQGVIIEPCWDDVWHEEQPLRLDCDANYVRLITTENLPLEEAGPLIIGTQQKIAHYMDTVSCTGSNDWDFTVLLEDNADYTFIPFFRKTDFTELKKIVSTHNILQGRILNAQEDPQFVTERKQFSGIDCIDGKPVVRYKELD